MYNQKIQPKLCTVTLNARIRKAHVAGVLEKNIGLIVQRLEARLISAEAIVLLMVSDFSLIIFLLIYRCVTKVFTVLM